MSELLPEPTNMRNLDDTVDLGMPNLAESDFARGDVADHANLIATRRKKHEERIARAQAKTEKLKALEFKKDTRQGQVTLTAEDSRRLNNILRDETPVHETGAPSNTPPHPVLRKIFTLPFMRRLLVGRHNHT